MAAGEAPIQKVTISHVGGRWQESALERYLIRYQIRPVFQSVVFPPALGQSGTEAKRLPEAKPEAVQPIPPTQDVAGLRPETKNADPRTGKTGMRSLSREAGRLHPVRRSGVDVSF